MLLAKAEGATLSLSTGPLSPQHPFKIAKKFLKQRQLSDTLYQIVFLSKEDKEMEVEVKRQGDLLTFSEPK